MNYNCIESDTGQSILFFPNRTNYLYKEAFIKKLIEIGTTTK